jgi:hypothetical protein
MATLFKVIHKQTPSINKTLGIFSFKTEAEEYLRDLLEEYHESIADAEDYHHEALDNRFLATHKIVPFNH